MKHAVVVIALLAACEKHKAAPDPTPASGSAPATDAVADAAVGAAPPAIDAVGAAPAAIDASAAKCDELDRAHCLVSLDCKLWHVHDITYECRPSTGPCEVGLKQEDKKGCEARAQCAWQTGACYCPCVGTGHTTKVDEPSSGCRCACAGGAPSRCIEKK